MRSTTRRRSGRASSKAAFRDSRPTSRIAQIVDPASVDADGRIVFGATVELEDMESGNAVCYQIVGDDEADIRDNKISIESPIARALIGKSPATSRRSMLLQACANTK